MCRETIAPENLCCFGRLESKEIMLRVNKMDHCISLLSANPTHSFLIYSSFDNIYYQLYEEMDKRGLRAEKLMNHLPTFRKTIKNFQDQTTKILFVSQADVLRGLSFPMITHLIFYHEPSFYEWKELLIQLLQRAGRTQPLNILHLHSEIQV